MCRMDIDADTSGKTIVVTVELPGVHKKDIKIEVHHGALIVSGDKRKPTENIRKGNSFATHERLYGKFVRSVQLPHGTKVSAVYRARLV